MTSATMKRRTQTVEAAITARAAERTLHRIAGAMDIAPELLRAEALALQERFTAVGVMTIEAQLRMLAEEIAVPVDEVRRQLAEVVDQCGLAVMR